MSTLTKAAALLAAATCLSLVISGAVQAAPAGPMLAATKPFAQPAAVIYTQPPVAAGGLYQASQNGSDYDWFAWDGFMLPAGATGAITDIQWRGAYDPGKFESGGPVLDFTVAIYPSIAGGSQPDVIHPPLVNYQVGGNAGEAPAGPSGSLPMTYDYSFTLPASFQATGGTRYWIYIESTQAGIPDWGIVAGSGGDSAHYMAMAVAGDIRYSQAPGDLAFTLTGVVSSSPRLFLPLLLR